MSNIEKSSFHLKELNTRGSKASQARMQIIAELGNDDTEIISSQRKINKINKKSTIKSKDD